MVSIACSLDNDESRCNSDKTQTQTGVTQKALAYPVGASFADNLELERFSTLKKVINCPSATSESPF